MKILAIRGCNLASLDGEFEIDFTADSLAQDGLIAITGATGSGKSTILDALCLALFNRIPRLPTRGSQTLIGRKDEDDKQRLASHDVRHILRRGTGEGYAEVDFLGVDKKQYRATWTIRRARKRPDGRFQAPEHQCISLSDEKPLGRTRKEVEERIVEKLGLTIDQFRRSVLLAQGDFASFLKADAATRSHLLEMITGTEIYGEISRQAHRRANEEVAKLNELQTRLNEYDTLDNDARAALIAEVAAQAQQLQQQENTLKQWQQQVDQLERIRTQHQQLKQAKAKQKQQKNIWQDSQAERDELHQLKQLQSLRLPLQRVDDASAAYHKIQSQQAPAKQQYQRSKKQLAALAVDLDKQQEAYQQAETTLQQAKPELRQAYQLDNQLQQIEKEQQDFSRQREAADKQRTALQHAIKAKQSALQASQQEQSKINDWLAQQRADEPLAAQWTHWESLFDDLLAKTTKQRGYQQDVEKLTQAQANSVNDLQASEKIIAESQQQLSELEKELSMQNEQNIQSQLDQCIADIQADNRHLIQLKEQEKLQHQYQQNQREQSTIRAELEQLQRSVTQAQKVKASTEQALLLSNVRLDEATQKNKRALLATSESIESLRSKLNTGEACPVCGSQAHPFHSEGNEKLHIFAEMQEKRVQELQAENTNLKQQLQQASSEIRFSEQQHLKQTTALQTAQKQADALLKQWQAQSTVVIDAFKPAEEITLQQQQLQAKQQQQQKLSQQRAEAQHTRQQKDDCLNTLRQQQTHQQSLEKTTQKRQSDIQHLKQQIAELQTESQHIQQRLDSVIQHIDFASDGIADDRQDVAALKYRCQQRAENYQQQQKQQAILEQQISHYQNELEIQQVELAHVTKNLQQYEKTQHSKQQEYKALKQSRQGLFVGYAEQNTEQIEQALNTQLEQSKATYEATQQQHQQLKETLISQETHLHNLEHNEAERSEILDTQKTALEQALVAFNISEATAREKLNKDAAWIKQQEQIFEQRKQALHTSQIHVQTAAKKLAGGLALIKPSSNAINLLKIYTDDALAHNQTTFNQQLQAAEQAYATTQKHHNELQFQLREDNNKRKQAKKLQKAYDQQHEINHVWRVMKELIGSQTGAKFRNFAQSLTLEILLSHANQRMQELNRRYALQRVPQTDLELQIIDKEMGDEIRPVHSLSGGESFLVSLALALGLASLSSRKTQIDSLFIDEGFGTLDPQTLDTALSALDSLQSQGKTVCIISHVTAITERVAAQIRVKTYGNGKSRVESL